MRKREREREREWKRSKQKCNESYWKVSIVDWTKIYNIYNKENADINGTMIKSVSFSGGCEKKKDKCHKIEMKRSRKERQWIE